MSTNAHRRHPRVLKLAWLLAILLVAGTVAFARAPQQAAAAPPARLAHLPTQDLSLGPCTGAGVAVTCQFATDATVPIGATWTEQVSLPAGTSIATTTQGPCGGAIAGTGVPGGVVTIGPCTATLPAGTPITVTLNLPAPVTNIQISVVYNANGPINSPLTNTVCQGTTVLECNFVFPFMAGTPQGPATATIVLPCGSTATSCTDAAALTNYTTLGGTAGGTFCAVAYTNNTPNNQTALAVVTCAAGSTNQIAAGSVLDITYNGAPAPVNFVATATMTVVNPVTVPAPSLARETFGPPTPACTPAGPTTLNCSFVTDVAVAVGGTFTEQISSPTGVAIASTTQGPCGGPVSGLGVAGGQVIIGPCTGAVPPGTQILQTLTVPAGVTSASEYTIYNANGPSLTENLPAGCQGTATLSCSVDFPYTVAPTTTANATATLTVTCTGASIACNPNSPIYATVGGTNPGTTHCNLVYTQVTVHLGTAVATCLAGTTQQIGAGTFFTLTSSAAGSTVSSLLMTIAPPTTIPAPLGTLVMQTVGTSTCNLTGPTTLNCSFNSDIAVPAGGTLKVQISLPQGVSITAFNAGPCGGPVSGLNVPGGIVTVGPCTATIPAGTPITDTLTVPVNTFSLTQQISYNSNGPVTSGLANGGCTGQFTLECYNSVPFPVIPSGTAPATATFLITCGTGTLVASCTQNQAPTSIDGCPIVYTTTPGTPPTFTGVATCAAGSNNQIPANTVVTLHPNATAALDTGSEVTTVLDPNPVPAALVVSASLTIAPAKTCTASGTPVLINESCTVVNGTAPIPSGGSLMITQTSPPIAPGSLACTGVPGLTTATTIASGPTCIFTNISPNPIGPVVTVGTEAFLVAPGTAPGIAIVEVSSVCTNAVQPCSPCTTTPTQACLPNVPVTCIGACITGTPPTPTPPPTPAPPPAPGPLTETKYCTNTISGGGSASASGGLGVSGPATSFTLPTFGPASTCAIQILQGGVACNTAGIPCPDGNVIVTLSTPGSGAAISCSTTPNPPGQPFPPSLTTSANGGSCQSQAQGTQLALPCGATAGTPAANTTPSSSCDSVFFDISSVLGACINTPNICINPGTIGPTSLGGLNTGPVTLTVQFAATPANGGAVGGIQLGTNTFSFASGIGTLLVTASPQLIPSNGTLASVVSATFACSSLGVPGQLSQTINGFNSVGGFPLSTTTPSNVVVNGNGTLSVSGQGCGAGLAGTFQFSSTGPVIFDNSRQAETITCGPSPVSSVFLPRGSLAPLAFTCTGAAVLALGAGVAGDATINVAYQSAAGVTQGLQVQAVGSTMITVAPSGTPRISVACSPTTIAAGSTGSLCTATVTDQNGKPLSGLSGATVTFTTSDTRTTTILACTIGTPGAINVTTAPVVLPQITPQTPCALPSSTIPAQVNTWINGQATALLVASTNAVPETVTVTAALGVLIPPEFACLVAPYLSTGVTFGAVPNTAGYYSAPSALAGAGCGSATPIGSSGLATALNTASTGFTGVVSMPNATSASTTVSVAGATGIQIAGASPISPILLARGCSSVIVTSLAGTPLTQIAGRVGPSNAVVSIWRFDNASKTFKAGFFVDASAPVDFNVTGTPSTFPPPDVTETYYVCVNQQATMR